MVQDAQVSEVLARAVAAKPRDVFALRRIVQISKAGVIDLQVSAPEAHQLGDFVCIDSLEVVPEPVEVRVYVMIDGCTPSPVVHHIRRRDRKLRRLACNRFQKVEVLGEYGSIESEPFLYSEGGGSKFHL